MPSPLTGILSARARKYVYTTYATVGLLIGCAQAGYGAVSDGMPDPLKVVLAVYAFIGTAIGATAASNVDESKDERPRPRRRTTRKAVAARPAEPGDRA